MQLSIPNAGQVLISGSADETVPPFFSRDYVAAKQQRTQDKKENVQLIEIAGARHFDVIDPRSQAWKTIEETVLGLLGS